MRVYLGLDASTQSLTAVLIGVERGACRLLGERSVNYDRDLPHYGTHHGVIRGEGGCVEAPPLMWAEALDRMMAALSAEEPVAMARLAAVSGAAQQHGSVYLTTDGIARIVTLAPRGSLVEGLHAGVFARDLSPVWLDSSTERECREIEEAVGGRDALEARTGARAFDRFTGPQIRAFARRDPAGYAATARVHLVSSFHASLLAGRDMALEVSEASGTNLMDLRRCKWWRRAVRATADELATRLPFLSNSMALWGLAPYWTERHGLPLVPVGAWTGDNPSTLLGSGITRPGTLSISLGTSDTACAFLDERPAASGAGYVGVSPLEGYLATTTFSNGSLARERVRDEFGYSWDDVALALDPLPDAEAGLMLPWFEPEITPRVSAAGARRLHLRGGDGPASVRAVIEGQMMAIARHTRWMSDSPALVSATGGASVNRAMLQIMADVFGGPVVRPRMSNSSALGAALRAWLADERLRGRALPWTEIADLGVQAAGGVDRIDPRPQAVEIYARLRERHRHFEETCVTEARSGTPST